MQWVGFLLVMMLGTSLYWNFQSLQDQNEFQKQALAQATRISSLEKQIRDYPPVTCPPENTVHRTRQIAELRKELKFQTEILDSMVAQAGGRRQPNSIEPIDSITLDEDIKKQHESIENLTQERNSLELEMKQLWFQHRNHLAQNKSDTHSATQAINQKIRVIEQNIQNEMNRINHPSSKSVDGLLQPQPKPTLDELKAELDSAREEKHQLQQTFSHLHDALMTEFQKNEEELRSALRQTEERQLTERAIYQLLQSESRGLKQHSHDVRSDKNKFNQSINQHRNKVQNIEKQLQAEEARLKDVSTEKQ